MHTWKSVLTCIIVVYLIIACAISMAVQYLVNTPRPLLGRQEHSDVAIAIIHQARLPATTAGSVTSLT